MGSDVEVGSQLWIKNNETEAVTFIPSVAVDFKPENVYHDVSSDVGDSLGLVPRATRWTLEITGIEKAFSILSGVAQDVTEIFDQMYDREISPEQEYIRLLGRAELAEAKLWFREYVRDN